MSTEQPTVPYGYCHCGCGGNAPISPVNHVRLGYVKGEPRKYIRGHATRKHHAPADVRARSGVCECGCGQETEISAVTNPAENTYAGFPLRFVKGHNAKVRARPNTWTVTDCGYATPCWLWDKSRSAGGYGQVTVDGDQARAHRYVYEQLVGPIPEGLVLDHLCRNPPCVNPAHLEPVTNAENCRRGAKAKLTQADANAIRRLLADGALSYRVIASRFGVSKSVVGHIAAGRAWSG